MLTDSSPAPPRVLPGQVAALRTDLLGAEYTVSATEALLGEVAVAALRRENPVPARRALTGRREPAAVLLGLFTLGAAVPRSQVQAALPTLGVQGAIDLGLIGPVAQDTAHATSASPPRSGDDHAADDPDPLLHALIDLAPYVAQDDQGEIAWWIASDLSELATGRALHHDHVLGVGGASLTLARITPRERVSRVLDLGCGSGIQALHASRHADHVIGTDLSPRALAFAAFNAALNGIALELREGSLFDPVAGEAFDLIVSNPPFVISPRDRVHDDPAGPVTWTYRDGGRTGDTLLGELLAALPAHLAPGGSAVMLGNWEIAGDIAGQEGAEDPPWDARPRAWLDDALAEGVDCWVVERESEDPARYAETWARDGGITERDPEWDPLLRSWLDDFASRGVGRIGFGYLLARRPVPPRDAAAAEASRRGVLRTERAPGTGSGTLSTHLSGTLRAIDLLAETDDAALEEMRPVRAADVTERRHLVPGQWDPMLIELVQGGGFARVVAADQVLAASVGALDGTLTLGQTLAAVCALTGDDPAAAHARTLPAVRELITCGMLEL